MKDNFFIPLLNRSSSFCAMRAMKSSTGVALPTYSKPKQHNKKPDRISYSNVCLLQIQLYNFPRQHCVNPHLAKYIPRILKQIVQGADF